MHPVGGEGVGSTFLDDGGLWPSEEARGKETSGVLVGWRVDSIRLLAARCWTADC